MPRTIRFHLDEHCDPGIAAGLRLHGVDVMTTPEAGLLHAADEEHLAYGVAAGRVIFTQDRDFLRLHAAGEGHCGIAYCAADSDDGPDHRQPAAPLGGLRARGDGQPG